MYPHTNQPPRFLVGLLITLLLGGVTILVTTAPAQAAPDALTTIDADGDVGRHSSVAINDAGNPVVAYRDSTSNDLNLARCLNTACSAVDIVPIDTGGDTGEHPSIALDSAGRPVIAYTAASSTGLHEAGLRLAQCQDVACSSVNIQVLFPNIDVHPSLAMTSSDRPVVSFTTGGVAVGYWCTDVACTAFDGVFIAPSTHPTTATAVDGEIPVFAYVDTDLNELQVSRCPDIACNIVPHNQADDGMDVFANFDMTLDANGRPVVAYRESGSEQLEIVRCANVDCAGNETGRVQAGIDVDPSGDIVIRMDDHDRPVIAYQPYNSDDIAVYQCLVASCPGNGGVERRPVIADAEGRTIGMALRADSDAVISWYDEVQDDLELVRCDSHGCGSIPTIPAACDFDPTTATVIHGTSSADVLVGTAGPDIIFGYQGNDTISGLAGNDCLIGGSGRDTIDGNAGHDLILGKKGRDILDGGKGHDRVKGNKAADQIVGGSGNDTLKGGGGNDTINGNGGNDTVKGNKGRDTLLGGSGSDALKGGKGSDVCTPSGGSVSGCETVL